MDIKIDGGILAGGLSSRMGGIDKGLTKFKNQAMVNHVYGAFSSQLDTIYINCNKNHDQYRLVSPNICSDSDSEFLGPLAGILSLITASNATAMIISPCDTPNLSPEIINKLLLETKISFKENPHQKILFAVKENNNFHPLHLCISCSYRDELKHAITLGTRRVMQWVKENNVRWIDFSEYRDSFDNINTLKDVADNS